MEGEVERAIGRQELALDAVEESGVDMVLAGHNHHASSQDASDLVTRAGGVLVVQAGTATSTRVREQEQSFNTIDIADHSAMITVHAWKGDGFKAGRRPALSMAGRPLAPIEKHGAGALRRRMALPDGFDLDEFVTRVLAEDLGKGGDVTSAATIAADARFSAEMNARQALVVAGIEIAAAFFRSLDAEATIEVLADDGNNVEPGTTLMRLVGNARAMLAAERSALNTLQHLSGIATLTRRYVDAIAGTGAVLLDTRKTIPGLRVLDKYAARMGGAQNYRMRLDDAILIKDNHVAVCGGVADAVRRAKSANTGLQVLVEVDRVDQIEPALADGADRLLLDNMEPPMLRSAVALVARRVPLEASGGVTLETIRSIAETGVDFISVGRITQSAPAVDIGLDYSTDPQGSR